MNDDNIRSFVLAGNATFTVRSKRTGQHLTYKVQKKEAEGERPVWFAQVMTDGADGYTYLGMVGSDGKLRTTKASKFTRDSRAFTALAWTIDWLQTGLPWPAHSAEFHHAGRCGRCGRELTDPVSIERGLGPECSSKL
jgi:hypothetical protein